MLIGISGKIGSGKDTLALLIGVAMYAKTKNIDVVNEELLENAYHHRALQLMNISIHKFAGPLKNMVCILTGCTRENLESMEFKESNLPKEWNRAITDAKDWLSAKGVHNAYALDPGEVTKRATELGFKWERTYRELLQELGTNILRTWIPDVHVNATMASYKPIAGESRHWLGHAISIEEPKADRMPRWIITDLRFPNEAAAIKERGGILIRLNRKQPEGTIGTSHSSETSLDNYTGWDVVIDNNGTLDQLYQEAKKIVERFNLLDQ